MYSKKILLANLGCGKPAMFFKLFIYVHASQCGGLSL